MHYIIVVSTIRRCAMSSIWLTGTKSSLDLFNPDHMRNANAYPQPEMREVNIFSSATFRY